MFSRADAYERFMGRWSRLLAPKVVAFADVREGDAILDVGCGTGELSFAARDAANGTRVTGVDPSPEYTREAEQRARRSSTSDERVRFRVGDAQELPFAEHTFDKALSMLVLNFVPDAARAAREMARVTKPGGTVAAAVWDYGGAMEMLRVFWEEAAAFDASFAARDEGRMPLCREGELADLLRGTDALADVVAVPLEVPLRFASFDDYWEPFLLGQGPAGDCATSLSPERRVELRERLRARLVKAGAGPFELRGRAWAAKGTRSSSRNDGIT